MATVRTESPRQGPAGRRPADRAERRRWPRGGVRGCPRRTRRCRRFLEAIPYRLADGMAARDAGIHPYFAGHGYAAVRADLRAAPVRRHPHRRVCRPGTEGPARGHRLDRRAALVRRQRRDGRDFRGRLHNSLPVRPPSVPRLRGHHHAHVDGRPLRRRRPREGGRVLATDLLHWSSCMLHWQCQPPHEARRRRAWREMWVERLEASQPWVHHRPLRTSARRLLEARLRVRGLRRHRGPRVRDRWLDRRATPYPSSAVRRSQGTAEGLIGPGPNAFPHDAVPGPEVGYLQEAPCAALPLAQGRAGQRYRRRTDAPGNLDQDDLAPAPRRAAARPLGRRGALAIAADPDAALAGRRRCASAAGRGDGRRSGMPEAGSRCPRAGCRGGGRQRRRRRRQAAYPRLAALRRRSWSWCAEGQVSDWAPDQRAAEGQSLTWTLRRLGPRRARRSLGVTRGRCCEWTSDRPLALAAVRLDDVARTASRASSRAQQDFNLTHPRERRAPRAARAWARGTRS